MEPIAVPGTPWVLRPWRDDARDAAALAAAWADEAVRARCGVPDDAGAAAARRWVADWDERRRRGLALDLVVSEGADGAARGEVGLWPFRRHPDGPAEAGVLEVGWWTGAEHRGRGQARAAVRALLDWAEHRLPVDGVVARTGPAHPAAEAIARAAGMAMVEQHDDASTLWRRDLRRVGSVPARAPGPDRGT